LGKSSFYKKTISNKIDVTHAPLSHLIAFTVVAGPSVLSLGIHWRVALINIFSIGDGVFGSILRNGFLIITRSFRLKYDDSNQAS
jgi:hypothetical protein